MLSETYGGAVLGFLSVALTILLLNNAVKWHLTGEAASERVKELASSSLYKLGVCLLLALIAYSNYVLFREVKSQGGAWILIGAAWAAGSCIFSFALIVRAFFTRIILREEHVEIRTPSHAVRMSWTSLQRVEWNRYGWSFELVGAESTVSVGVFMVGIRTLLEEIEQRAPNAEMTEVRRTLEDFVG